ncbi:MAG: hypothetical protein ACXW3D_06845 [Caulobacteraceae bacterium]
MLIGWKAAGADRTVASLRYRVEAPLKALRARGHAVEVLDPARAGAYDVAVFAKAYSPADRTLAMKVKAAGGRVVFDLCDNHFYNPYDLPKYRKAREHILDMLSIADSVVCATPALAAVLRQEAPWAPAPQVIGDAAEIIPSARPSLPPFEGARFLWFGSHGSPNAPSGMADILLVAERLIRLSRSHPIELVVCSNDKAKFQRHIAPLPFATRYVEWSLDGFPGVLNSANAVIIPISSNPFTACKTHNRLTTALAAGVPVIADAIESYREFAPFSTLDDWDAGLRAIAEHPETLRGRAVAARAYIDQHWSAAALAPLWERALAVPARISAEARIPEAEPAGHAAAVACQGGLDLTVKNQLTGWARAPGLNGPLHVRLERDGEVVARAQVNLEREDLARAGMPDTACGFSVPPPETSERSAFRLIVEETGWDFGIGAFELRPALRGGYRVAAIRSGASASTHAPRPGAPVAQSEPVTFTDTASMRDARNVQDRLLAELESLDALMTEARDVAARLVVAAGDDAALASRLLTQMAQKPKVIHDRRSPEAEPLDPQGTRLN